MKSLLTGYFLYVLFLVYVGMLCLGKAALAQEQGGQVKQFVSDLQDFKLEKAEDKVSVATSSPLSLKDAPAPVTVLTDEDIMRSGARDLIDVLRFLPGFETYCDVQGVVGLGIRGIAANESILILVDGHEMNELMYASNQFGNRMPVDQIRRIEVIRGPGSVTYGGFAVQAVINILTKATDWYNGVHIAQTLGECNKGLARRNFTGAFGIKKKDFKLSFMGYTGVANRSNRNYTDAAGKSYNLFDQSRLESRMLSACMKVYNFHLKVLLDKYHTLQRDNQTIISSRPYPLDFANRQVDFKYHWVASSRFQLIPFLNYRTHLPWQTLDDIDSVDRDITIPYDWRVQRLQGGANYVWNVNSWMELSGGTNHYNDIAHDRLRIDGYEEEPTQKYSNTTAFTQVMLKSKIANLSLGGRYDRHSYFRPFFTPRIALTKIAGPFHFKTLFNRSFRTPAIENIRLSIEQRIKPQLTNYLEAEIGYEIKDKLQLILNVYDISIKDGITFYVLDDGFTEGYSNAARHGTSGVELQSRYRNKSAFFQATYSFYTTQGKDVYEGYHVPGRNVNLAFPAHRFTIVNGIKLSNKISLNNTFTFTSNRYAFWTDPENPEGFYKKYPPRLKWNGFLNVKDWYIKGLTIGVGFFNIFNSQAEYIQAYNSGHNPLPGMARELSLKIVYGLNVL